MSRTSVRSEYNNILLFIIHRARSILHNVVRRTATSAYQYRKVFRFRTVVCLRNIKVDLPIFNHCSFLFFIQKRCFIINLIADKKNDRDYDFDACFIINGILVLNGFWFC